MAKMGLKVQLDIDLDEYRAEYGDPSLTLQDIRELIRQDLVAAFDAAPYREALREATIK